MIEIPIGKAIAAVEVKEKNKFCRKDCVFYNNYPNCIACRSDDRDDGKNVIFKLVDINSHYINGTGGINPMDGK